MCDGVELKLDELPWLVKRDNGQMSGAELSTKLSPFCANAGWLSTTLPATVLTTLMANGVVQDIFSASLDEDTLPPPPDIYHAGPNFYTFWWCCSFRARCSGATTDQLAAPAELLLTGVNYRVDAYLNGRQLLSRAAGPFLPKYATVPGGLLNAEDVNCLALRIRPPDHPGCSDRGGQGGDGQIARDCTSQFVQGWDWCRPVPDRNTGIAGAVRIRLCAGILVRNLHIVPTVRLSSASAVPAAAELESELAAAAPGNPLSTEADVAVTVFLRNLLEEEADVEVTICIEGPPEPDADPYDDQVGMEGISGQADVRALFPESIWPAARKSSAAAASTSECGAAAATAAAAAPWNSRWSRLLRIFQRIRAAAARRPNASRQGTRAEGAVQVGSDGRYCVVEAVATLTVRVPAGASSFPVAFDSVAIGSPRLWWPRGMGAQPRYSCQASASLASPAAAASAALPAGRPAARGGRGQAPSDEARELFGLRHLRLEGGGAGGAGAAFWVNGRRAFARGANWVSADACLRGRGRTTQQLRLAASAGMNFVRVWGGAAAEATHPRSGGELYEACDALGLLVWQEFWITGDCNGRGAPPDPLAALRPDDHGLFLASAAATVAALRNRACVAIWCGGNEQRPAPDLDCALRRMLAAPARAPGTCGPLQRPPGSSAANCANCADGGADGADGADGAAGPNGTEVTDWESGASEHGRRLRTDEDPLDSSRPYASGSLWDGFGSGDGGWSDGPYTAQEVSAVFDPAFYRHAFNPEVGSVGIPSIESVRRMFATPQALRPPAFLPVPSPPAPPAPPGALGGGSGGGGSGGGDGGGGSAEKQDYVEVPSAAWDARCFQPHGAPGLVRNQLALLGVPRDLREYCQFAAAAQYAQFQALAEAWGSRMWRPFTGMLFWKLHGPSPSLRSQLIDYFGETLPGFHAAQAAMAAPLHAQLNRATMQVEIVSTAARAHPAGSVVLSLAQCSPSGGGLSSRTLPAPAVAADTAEPTGVLVEGPTPSDGVRFLRLTLRSQRTNDLLSRSVYWLAPPGGDYSELRGMPCADVLVEMTSARLSEPAEGRPRVAHVVVTLRNAPSGAVAFLLRLQVLRGAQPALMTADKEGRFGAYSERRLLPVYWSANYVTLLPDDTTTIHATFELPEGPSVTHALDIMVTGFNVAPRTVPIDLLSR